MFSQNYIKFTTRGLNYTYVQVYIYVCVYKIKEFEKCITQKNNNM